METNNNEEMYYPRSPTRFVDDEEEVGDSLFISNNNSPTMTIIRNPFDVPTTSTISAFGNVDTNDNMDFNYQMNEQHEESILPPQPQLSACSHSYPDNINEFAVENVDELMQIGKVFNVVEKKVTIEVIVDKNSKVNDLVSQNNVNLRENNSLDPDLIRKQLKLQVGALLFTKEGKPIGKITDIFGTVTKPFYVLTYPDISTMRIAFNIPQEIITSSSEPASKKEEPAQPPSTPTKQKSDSKLSTPKKTDIEDIDDFFAIPDPRELKVVELKPYLQRRGLSPWGKKKNLIAKIRKFERDKRKNQQKGSNSDSDDDSSNSDSESSSSEEEGTTLFTPKKQEPKTQGGEKFALRSLKDLEGMESDEEEHDTKKDEKKNNNTSNTTEKLSQSEIARIKDFGLIYCHNFHSARLDETSTQHMILNHTKAYDAMFNSDDKTEVMTFSDDEDESAFKHQKKEERKNPPPPVPVLKRKYDEALTTTSASEEKQAETPTKVSKKLPFIDISEAKQQEKANIESTTSQQPPVQNENENAPTISESIEEEPKPQITPKQTQNTKSTPKSRSTTKTAGSSSAARKPRARQSTAVIQTTQDEEPSFLSKWCLIM